MDKNHKKEVVKNLTEKFKNSSALYFTKYTGMSVTQATELRANFKNNNVDYLISKNTLTKIAIDKSGLDSNLKEYLSGQVGIAYANEDPTAPAKIIKEFSKSNECIEVLGLLFDGEIYKSDKYKELADLPSRDELLTKFVLDLNSPITKIAHCLNSSMSNFVNVLNSLKEIK